MMVFSEFGAGLFALGIACGVAYLTRAWWDKSKKNIQKVEKNGNK